MFITMSRKSMINVRLAEQTHEEFKIVAELRGASMSTLLHQFIVKAIREEKELAPQAFVKKPLPDAHQAGEEYQGIKQTYGADELINVVTIRHGGEVSAGGKKKIEKEVIKEDKAA